VRRLRWGWLALLFLALLSTCRVMAEVRDPATLPEQLRPGDFVWLPEAAPEGPLLLVVSLVEQRAYLYRNGVRIAVTTVSTGKPGFETTPGVYTILQKHREHFSNLYDNAPMPFMQRLTWSGMALHAGRIPGYPASHGCVRLPNEFARRLFEVTGLGMTVVVASDRAEAPQLVHPGWLAPPVPGRAPEATALAGDAWTPGLAPDGPMTILVGTSERMVRVLRNGIEIGRAPFHLEGEAPTGLQVLQLQAGHLEQESAYVPGKPRLRWVQVSFGEGATAAPPRNELYGRVHVAPEFARRIYDALVPGTTVVVTDAPTRASAPDATLLDSEPEPDDPG
jgi:hypothetical protein